MDHQKSATILFVDDEDTILEITSEYFGQKNYRVLSARNGLEAVDLLKREKIDCCFTDINMPGMDGIELAEHIRQMDNTIPVIIMTGYPSLDNTIRTIKNGVVDFLIKPVNLSQMELCLNRVMRERKLFIDSILLKEEMEKKRKLEKLNTELKDRIEELNIFNTILSDFKTITKSIDVFRRLTHLAVNITHADASQFYIVESEMAQLFQLTATILNPGGGPGEKETWSCAPRSLTQTGSRADKQIAELVLEVTNDKLPLIIPNNSSSGRLPETIDSFAAVPLVIREKVFGVLVGTSQNKAQKITDKDLYYLTFMTQNAVYAVENLILYENIFSNLISTLDALVQAIEAKDPYTRMHSKQVAAIAVKLGNELSCTEEELHILEVSGKLHDIGKIGVPDQILLKPGGLTDEEYKVIKTHPVIGARIVGKLGLWDREKEIIRYHHERFDGSGYPEGLEGEDIPFLSRILSLADVFDAVSSDRVYRKRMETEKVREIINRGMGTQFDPRIVEAFQRLCEKDEI